MAYFQQVYEKKGGYNFFNEDMTGILSNFQLGEHITKAGRIVKRIYKASDSTYGVFEIEDDQFRRFVVAGQFPVAPELDGYYEFTGTVKESKRGRQLMVENYHSITPETRAGIITLLTTLPGLDTRASTLYEVFGSNVLDVIKTDPERVASAIKGISLGRAKVWQRHLQEKEKDEAGMERLFGLGLSPKQAGVLLEKYGSAIVDKIQDDPYFLMQEFPRFSFQKCDTIALKNGTLINDTSRLIQAMLYTLRQEAIAHGHCYLPEDIFLQHAMKVINMSLDYRMAEQLLKREGEEIPVRIGSNRAVLNKQSVNDAMMTWQASTKRQPFYYPIFNVDVGLVKKTIVLARNYIHVEKVDGGNHIYPAYLFNAERLIAKTIDIFNQHQVGTYPDRDKVIQSVCKAEKITLEERQLEAVETICSAPGGIYILTGSAGCGKTFTLNVILKVLCKLHKQLYNWRPFEAKILAPTGKAAKVASQATGLPASTIHMALGITQDGEYSKAVTSDVVVIDEFSMVDTMLAAELFAATIPTAKIIILGDTKQLPSIGPGLVLHDLIACGRVPTIELNVIKRQGKGSGILENANRIVLGNGIETITCGKANLDGDAYVIETGSAEICRSKVLQAVEKLIKLYPKDEVQVLSPQHKGETGTDALNLYLQRQLNPSEQAVDPAFLNRKVTIQGKETELYYLPGDKVIHTKNNYKMQWYQRTRDGYILDPIHVGIINGETGIIQETKVDGRRKVIIVQYDNGFVRYEDDFSELDHAYALTIHKAQGSQWAAVVSPIMEYNRPMLSRNLFYTMYTRAQHVSVTIGSGSAMDFAVKNDKEMHRFTSVFSSPSAPR